MLFLTIVFFAVSLMFLVKRNVFSKLSIDVGEDEIKKATDKNYKGNESLLVKLIFFILILVTYTVIEIIYLIKALSIDPYIYPTVLMILNMIISPLFAKKNVKKKDLTTEEGIKEYRISLYKNKRTLVGLIKSLFIIIYFAYMFYAQVF